MKHANGDASSGAASSGENRSGADSGIDSCHDPGKEWMLAFQAGDEAAFDELVRYYNASVRRFVGRYLSDADRAEDLAQEAFIRVFKARARYRPEAKFHTWLYTIVTRLCLNEIRSQRRERRALSIQRRRESAFDGPLDDPVEQVPERRPESPQERLEAEELDRVLAEAIRKLPDNQRAAILMLRFEEASYHDVGQVLGISVMAVKSLVNRARESLRASLERFRAASARAGAGASPET